MKKILVFGITNLSGGVESVIMNYYRNIDKSKIQFDFLCNSEIVAYEDEILKMGGKIYRVTARSKNYKKFKSELNDFFKQHAQEYSTIWVNLCSLANIDYLVYAKKYGIKYRIIHSHNSQNMDSKIRGIIHKINRLRINRFATDFWSCSDEAANWFYSKKIINSDKYLLINNAIDTNKFKYNPAIREKIRKELCFNNSFIVGNVGRFHFQKNHKFMIEIFRNLLELRPDSKLVLLGKGSKEEEIRNLVKELKIEDKVVFLGERNDIQDIIQGMDVFLFPSLFEGLPLALVEAQANGLPILASKDVISSKVKMSKNLEFVSLDESAKFWANKLNNVNLKNMSKENIEIIKQKGFDINTQVKLLENFFERN